MSFKICIYINSTFCVSKNWENVSKGIYTKRTIWAKFLQLACPSNWRLSLGRRADEDDEDQRIYKKCSDKSGFRQRDSVTRCWNKNLPNFLKFAKKVASALIYLNTEVFKIAQKSRNIWATFVRKFVSKSFQKLPIWSHCKKISTTIECRSRSWLGWLGNGLCCDLN